MSEETTDKEKSWVELYLRMLTRQREVELKKLKRENGILRALKESYEANRRLWGK